MSLENEVEQLRMSVNTLGYDISTIAAKQQEMVELFREYLQMLKTLHAVAKVESTHGQ